MGLLDVAILALIVWELFVGYRRGFWLTAAEYLGIAAGFFIAVALAPRLIELIDVSSLMLRLLLTLLILAFGTGLGGAAGRIVGEAVRSALPLVRPIRFIDGIAGAALTAIVTLAMVWYVGLTASRLPNPQLASLIDGSTILRQLDILAPRPPAELARLELMLSSRFFPQVFAGIEPRFPSTAAPDPAVANIPAVAAAARSVVRIEGIGCGGLRFGSGFPIGDGRVITNAHVVSGTGNITIQEPGSRARLPATVIFFDPDRDLALMLVPGLTVAPLTLAGGQPGSSGAIIGYPGGGPEVIAPAVIANQITARGRDIYGKQLVNREIWVVRGEAQPGDSGGPLVDANGQAVGVIFASSINQPDQSYALTSAEVSTQLARAAGQTQPINTRQLACVR